MSAGFQMTVAFVSGSRSHQVNQFDDDQGGAPANGDIDIAVTLANWYLEHKQLGRLTVGRINTATAGLSTIDLGGAGVVANASIGYWNRGFAVTTTGPVSSINGWSNFLGGNALNGASLSRANAVMYTTPTVGGFSLSAAWGEDDQYDVAARYAGEFSGFRVAAGLGYRWNYSGLGEATKDNPGVVGPEPEQLIASGSILHVKSGLYLTGSYINQENDNGLGDTTLWYVQGGIGQNWTGLGKTVFYGEYARVEDGLFNFAYNPGAAPNPAGASNPPIERTTAEVLGIGVVQHKDPMSESMTESMTYRPGEVLTQLGSRQSAIGSRASLALRLPPPDCRLPDTPASQNFQGTASEGLSRRLGLLLAAGILAAGLAGLPAASQTPPQAPPPGAQGPAAENTTVVPRVPKLNGQGQITLSVSLTDGSQPIAQGLVWRVFRDKAAGGAAGAKGLLVSTHKEASPTLRLDPGIYWINVALGRASLTRKIAIVADRVDKAQLVLNAGGLRIVPVLANGQPANAKLVAFDVESDERDEHGQRTKVVIGARAGVVLRLNAGLYNVLSRYGDANATARADVSVEAGRLTEARVIHPAAEVSFKLVIRGGGDAIADTQWSVATRQGQVVRETSGALPTHILAPGAYTVSARHAGRQFRRDFAVKAGDTTLVEVVMP